jgi:hypothetical protein
MITATHEIAPEELMAYHDGELPADRAEEVSTHLNACQECRNLAESLDATSQSLAEWTLRPLPPTLQPSTTANALLKQAHDSDSYASLWQKLRAHKLSLTLGAMATLTVLAVFGITADRFSRPNYYMAQQRGLSVDKAQVALPPRAPEEYAWNSNGVVVQNRLGVDKLASSSRIGEPPATGGGGAGKAPTQSENAELATAQTPMIARTAELQIVATKFDAARAAVESTLFRHRGYAASLSVGDADNTARTLNASLRIPAPELTAALTELKAIGHVTSESQAGEEVTAAHADLVARLTNSRETETRLQDILRNRTGKVADVLEVEQEIARVRGEIEQMESDLKTLNHRVDFATINLIITEEYKAKVSDTAPGIATRFHNAAVAGFKNVSDSALGLVLWFTEYLPPIIFWLVVMLAPFAIFWRLRRRALAAATASPLA